MDVSPRLAVRVHTGEASPSGQAVAQKAVAASAAQTVSPIEHTFLPDEERIPIDEFETKMVAWTTEVVVKMGYPAKVSVLFREEKKIGLKIDTDNTSIIIGKKGKNIDALQLLANVYAGKLGREDIKVILDSENYRIRREESLVRIAYESAEQVRRTGRSILLEPMNPFERRIVHTTLNDIVDIETKSEGEGLYKQVRVMFRGRK